MSMSAQFNLQKIQQLVTSATNPRRKAMYQTLLEKARHQLAPLEPFKDQFVEPIFELPEYKLYVRGKVSDKSGSKPIFQAIGVIEGEVNFAEDGKGSITVDDKQYSLLPVLGNHSIYDELKQEVEDAGNHIQRLLVYPRVIHFPDKNRSYEVSFTLVRFDRESQAEGTFKILNNLEFRLLGLWQFIPVCDIPCVSVFRNFSKQRLEYIREIDVSRRVSFLKAGHVPLLWEKPSVEPFRFNPESGEKQSSQLFIQVKAEFLPQQDVFSFVEQLAEPRDEAPIFLKAPKEERAEVQRLRMEM